MLSFIRIWRYFCYPFERVLKPLCPAFLKQKHVTEQINEQITSDSVASEFIDSAGWEMFKNAQNNVIVLEVN